MASDLLRDTSPSLSGTFIATVLQFSIFLFGAWNFYGILNLCRATSRVGEHNYVKNVMVMMMYLYAPITAISITFSWIAWDQNWAVGYFFLVLPFIHVIFFFFILLVTKNDVSHFIDVTRAARGKLPYQAPPRTLIVGEVDSPVGNNPRSPNPHSTIHINSPPTLPRTEGSYSPSGQYGGNMDDDDAF